MSEVMTGATSEATPDVTSGATSGATSDRGAFIWYELMTPHPAGAKAFYDEVVGWNIDTRDSMPEARMDYRMIVRGDGGFAGGVLTMDPEMLDHGAKPGWFGYVHVPDVDAAARKVVDAGGAIRMGPEDMAGIGRMAMVADPWGAAIYLMTPTPPLDEPDAKSDVFSYAEAEHVRRNELWSDDPQGAVALYTDLFGWRQDEAIPMGEMGDYLFLHHGEGMIGALGKARADGVGSRWDYYIGVDDIDRAATAVEDGGGRLLGEIQQIPGGEYAVRCEDPHGAAFGVVGPREERDDD